LLLSLDSGMEPTQACDCWKKEKENPRGFTLAHLRRKSIRPGACGKCTKTIVIVEYI